MAVRVNSRAQQNAQQAAQKRDEEWNRMLANAKMAMAMNNETAIGMLLGKGLRELWMNHLAKRHAREDADRLKNEEVANGKISDVEAFRNANGNPVAPTLNVPSDWNQPTAEPTPAPTEPQYFNHTGAYDIGYTPEQKDYDLSRGREGVSSTGYQPIDLQEVLFGRRQYF